MDDYDRQKTGQHEPWPADILAQALKHKDAQTRLAVHLLYYTGQTMQTVEHYAAKVNRRALGQAAILKWDKRA